MGNSANRELKPEELQKLRRPNISDIEIQQIYRMFLDFEPSNGMIDVFIF